MTAAHVRPRVRFLGEFTDEEKRAWEEYILMPVVSPWRGSRRSLRGRCRNCSAQWNEWVVAARQEDLDPRFNEDVYGSCPMCSPATGLYLLTPEGLAAVVRALVERVPEMTSASRAKLIDAIADVDASTLAVAADLRLRDGQLTDEQIRHPRDAALVDELVEALVKRGPRGKSYLPYSKVSSHLSDDSHAWLLLHAPHKEVPSK